MKLFKLTLLFLLIPCITHGNSTEIKQEKTKTINKTFTVKKDATVSVDNKYGNITIATWNKKEVAIEVTITVKGNNEDRIEERLENITVEFDANESAVFAKTILEKSRNSWSFWNQNRNISHQINYEIKMPVSNNVNLDNDYGSIFIDNLDGNADINCDYGNITVAALNGENNFINLDYCNNSNIEFMKKGDVSLDYSKISINNSESLDLNADYTTAIIGKTNTISYNADYGAVTIKEANDIEGNSDYTNIKFGLVKNSVNVEVDYGAIKIDELAPSFKNVSIESQYAAVKIYVNPSTSFNFEIDLKYANLNGEKDKIKYTTKSQKPTKKYYKGSFGDTNNSSFLKIETQYGGVTIKKN